jgi:hypothetical protein
MEYLCHICRDWQETKHCEFHFEWTHGQSGVTLEKLQERLGALGGLSVRDCAEANEPKSEPFVTNNFRHS